MFQLFDLIMTSPIGVFIAGMAQEVIYAALIVSDCDECGFNDLGKLLFASEKGPSGRISVCVD